MKLWKRGSALVLALCMAVTVLAGCDEDPNDEDKISVVMTGEVSTVDPAMAETEAERTAVLHLFDNLYRFTDEGIVPAAAQSYQKEENEDGTETYTFRLRSDAVWTDGSAVTAEDFVYAWKRLVSPDTGSPNREILYMVAGYEDAAAGDSEALQVSAPDQETFVVTLSSPYPCFVETVCTAAATMPVQQKAVEGSEDWAVSRTWFVGNGPYRRTGDWSDSQFMTLVKQTGHYDARQTLPDRIEILYKSAEGAAADAGRVDVVIGAAAEEGGAAGGDPMVGVLLINQMATGMRTQLRQAMSLVIDRTVAAKTMGADYVAADGLVPRGIRTTQGEEFREVNGAVIDNDKETYHDRCEEAVSLLHQAGYINEGTLLTLGTVTLLYENTVEQTLLALEIQKMWKDKLGIAVTLQGEETEVYQQCLWNGEFTLALTELTALYSDASAYLDMWRSGDSRNYALVQMNAFDILMGVAAASTSGEARDAYLKDAEWLLLDSASVIPLYGRQQVYQIAENVTGVVSDGLGAWYFGGARRVTK